MVSLSVQVSQRERKNGHVRRSVPGKLTGVKTGSQWDNISLSAMRKRFTVDPETYKSPYELDIKLVSYVMISEDRTKDNVLV